MDRSHAPHLDLFSVYDETMQTIPITAEKPKLLHNLFYRASKSALRRQLISIEEATIENGVRARGSAH